MSFEINALSDIETAAFDTVIDVRAPAEFAIDHVPGAINLPVLSDEERARVGTIYTQESPFLARKIGAALVARNAARHIEDKLSDFDGAWRPLVYCWRGGQRSGSFASILQQIGWRVATLQGGYQAYRRKVVEKLYDLPFPTSIVLLDGNTGTGKTDILQRLPALDVQVIDLEGLANHRGSVLGSVGEQPTQKAFETRLAEKVEGLDDARPVVIEAESSKIGSINLPPQLFAAMKQAPKLHIEAPLDVRATYLTRVYLDALEAPEDFKRRLDALVRLQGRETVDAWKAAVDQKQYEVLAGDLMKRHYDPRYEKARSRRGADLFDTVQVSGLDEHGLDAAAARVAELVSRI